MHETDHDRRVHCIRAEATLLYCVNERTKSCQLLDGIHACVMHQLRLAGHAGQHREVHALAPTLRRGWLGRWRHGHAAGDDDPYSVWRRHAAGGQRMPGVSGWTFYPDGCTWGASTQCGRSLVR